MKRADDDLNFGYIPEQGMPEPEASEYLRHKLETLRKMAISDKNMIITVKPIRMNGTSLTVNITKEVKELGLDMGDKVIIAIKPAETH